jgi:hypothetical protein
MFFTALLRMARAWEYLKVHNGHVDWSNGMPTIVVNGVESETDTTGAEKYMVYQITDDTNDPPTAGWDWVRAHA